MTLPYTLHVGDCRKVMAAMEAESIDSIVSDPPYGLSFMGREWDHGVPGVPFWAEALRVAKPGAHLVAFGGSRTFHRLVCAVEDAGWEVRDVLMWLYGSGFPKSLDVSKAIDSGGGRPEDIRRMSMGDEYEPSGRGRVNYDHGGGSAMNGAVAAHAPKSDAARQWSGWGTALKPAYEPIILARKPLRGTVARNVQTFGTGAINVDACRIGTTKGVPASAARDRIGQVAKGDERGRTMATAGFDQNIGRWPANVLLDEAAAESLDQMAPQAGASAPVRGHEASAASTGRVTGERERVPGVFHGDRGGASRFFYTSKASGEDRERWQGNDHPTVKPTDLMRWLCRLVTPPGGLILDPFMGSGSTGVAAMAEGSRFVGVDLEPRYVEIAERRLKHATRQPGLFDAPQP